MARLRECSLYLLNKLSEKGKSVIGDTVYIYVGGEIKSIMYKCEVTAMDLYGNRAQDDIEYYHGLEKREDVRYMKLKLIEKYSEGQYFLPLYSTVLSSTTVHSAPEFSFPRQTNIIFVPSAMLHFEKAKGDMFFGTSCKWRYFKRIILFRRKAKDILL